MNATRRGFFGVIAAAVAAPAVASVMPSPGVSEWYSVDGQVLFPVYDSEGGLAARCVAYRKVGRKWECVSFDHPSAFRKYAGLDSAKN